MSEIPSYTGEGIEKVPEGEARLNLTREDISPPTPEELKPGGTCLVVQVNERDNRADPDSPDFGSLTHEGRERARRQAEIFFDKVFSELSDDERHKIGVMVCSSNTELIMPQETNSPHRRAFETGEEITRGILSSLNKFGIEPNVLLNSVNGDSGEPVIVPDLKDLDLWDHPELIKLLKEKWGMDEFWRAYEEDDEEEERLKMGAEGPFEIATRMRRALTGLTVDVAEQYHATHPGHRLFIWAVSHYDSVSPWIKGYVFQADPAKYYVPIEKGGGITVNFDHKSNTAKTKISGHEFSLQSLMQKPTDRRN